MLADIVDHRIASSVKPSYSDCAWKVLVLPLISRGNLDIVVLSKSVCQILIWFSVLQILAVSVVSLNAPTVSPTSSPCNSPDKVELSAEAYWMKKLLELDESSDFSEMMTNLKSHLKLKRNFKIEMSPSERSSVHFC